MPIFSTSDEALAWMAIHEGAREAMADEIIRDWKADAQEADEIDQEIAKVQRHNNLLADIRSDLASRAIAAYEALGDLDSVKATLERRNEALEAENTRLDGVLTKKRADFQLASATLDLQLREAKQAHALAIAESHQAVSPALAADQETIEASRQSVAATLTGHATQKNEADAAHTEVMRGYGAAEAEAKHAVAVAEKLRAELTTLRKP